ALFRELLLWTEYILRDSKARIMFVKETLVPFILKIHEYLESTLSVSEFSAMFVELRRASVDLAGLFGYHYPARRSAARMLMAFQGAKRSDSSRLATNIDIRLSKTERTCMQIARVLKARLVKSLSGEPNSLLAPCLSADTLDGQVWREAGLWNKMLGE